LILVVSALGCSQDRKSNVLNIALGKHDIHATHKGPVGASDAGKTDFTCSEESLHGAGEKKHHKNQAKILPNISQKYPELFHFSVKPWLIRKTSPRGLLRLHPPKHRADL